MNRTQDGTTERFYFSTDHLGSVTAVTNEAGELVWANEYAPFGTVYNDQTEEDWHRFFTGKDFDQTAGLYYFNARWYSAVIPNGMAYNIFHPMHGRSPYSADLGRFTSVDPARDGSNWHAYARNNPLLYLDPTGLKAKNKDESTTYSKPEIKEETTNTSGDKKKTDDDDDGGGGGTSEPPKPTLEDIGKGYTPDTPDKQLRKGGSKGGNGKPAMQSQDSPWVLQSDPYLNENLPDFINNGCLFMSSVYIAEDILGEAFTAGSILKIYNDIAISEGFMLSGRVERAVNAVNVTNRILAMAGSESRARFTAGNSSENASYSFVSGTNSIGGPHWAMGNGEGIIKRDPYRQNWIGDNPEPTIHYMEVYE